MENKIVILHVFDDEKFFDATARFFDALDNIINKYYFYTPDPQYKFKRIKSVEKIIIFNDYKKYCKQFSDKDIHIIYFHSLYANKYKLFNYISSDKKVIWWCFGADIYFNTKGLKPLVNLNLYKPITQKYINKNTPIKIRFKEVIKKIFSFSYKKLQNKVINRIDYFSPVLPIEYHLMKKNPLFRAKPFMLEAGPGIYIPKPLAKISEPKNILVGNSLTYTNNHLDIFAILNNIKLDHSRKFIVPISYGLDFSNDKHSLKNAFKTKQAVWLEEFIPRNEYIEYFESITHAIFGQIRQQAIGNINYCLEKGIKIYLYSDSLIYQQLKKLGYVVYNIEYDLTQKSLNEILDEESAKINYQLFCDTIKDRVAKTNKEIINIIH